MDTNILGVHKKGKERTMKRVIVELDETLHKRLKIYCFINGITVKAFVTECVEKSLKNERVNDSIVKQKTRR